MPVTDLVTWNRRPDVNHVVALFPDTLLAFDLPRDATLEDLAARLADFGERIEGAPLTISVRPAS
ncbi:MAG: hypothetical protein ACREFD_06775 [Stellaceae bacterium]